MGVSRRKVLLHDVIFEEDLVSILPDLDVGVIMATATCFFSFRVLNNTESSYFNLIKQGLTKEIGIWRGKGGALTFSRLCIYDIIVLFRLLKLTKIHLLDNN